MQKRRLGNTGLELTAVGFGAWGGRAQQGGYRRVTMIRENMENIPDIPFPEGFGVRNFRPGEGHIWTAIQRAAEPFIKIDDGLFGREFGRDLCAMEDRSFFLVTEDGREIGTITAWWSPDWRGGEWGQIHWVAVHPDWQGRGLSRPMMTVAMKRLKRSHGRAFLGTATPRIAGIKVYLDFGFRPDLEPENSREAWAEVAAVLRYPVFEEMGISTIDLTQSRKDTKTS